MPVSAEILKSVPLFASLNASQRTQVSAVADEITVAHGAYLYRYGDSLDHFHIIRHGTIQVFRATPAGQEVTSDILGIGDCINIDDIVTRRHTHNANARAIDGARILRLPIALLRTTHDLMPRILSVLTERLDGRRREAEQRATLSSAQIVACELQQLCATHQLDPAGFELPYAKALIASRLHIEPETFSRTLKRLRSCGITVHGSQVHFTDLETIDRFACGHCPVADDCATRHVFSPHRPGITNGVLTEKSRLLAVKEAHDEYAPQARAPAAAEPHAGSRPGIPAPADG